MNTGVSEQKALHRRALREKAQQFSASERAAASAQICQRLKEQIQWKNARSIMFYHPLAYEPDIQTLFVEALMQKKANGLTRYRAMEGQYQERKLEAIDLEV